MASQEEDSFLSFFTESLTLGLVKLLGNAFLINSALKIEVALARCFCMETTAFVWCRIHWVHFPIPPGWTTHFQNKGLYKLKKEDGKNVPGMVNFHTIGNRKLRLLMDIKKLLVYIYIKISELHTNV